MTIYVYQLNKSMPDIDIGSYWIRSLWFWKLVSRYLSIIVRFNHSSNHLTWVPTSMILLLFRVHWLKTRYFYRIFSTKRNISRWEIVMLRYYKSILMIRKSIPLNRIFSSSMKKELNSYKNQRDKRISQKNKENTAGKIFSINKNRTDNW